MCLCINVLLGTPFECSDGFARQMLSQCAVLHAMRLVLHLKSCHEGPALWIPFNKRNHSGELLTMRGYNAANILSPAINLWPVLRKQANAATGCSNV